MVPRQDCELLPQGKISKRRRRRDRTERMSAANKSLSMRDMAGLYHRKRNRIERNGVLARDRLNNQRVKGEVNK
jgi:hypothetical protein